ncbi:MAG: dihydroorotase [Caulobacteraceae bacterium]|nr:dihydroorotase [Caulobacter sp.]
MNRPFAVTGARLLERDGPVAVLVRDGAVADILPGDDPELGDDVERIDAGDRLLIPGLVDLRVKTGEPGAEEKETLKSASRAAAAGGVTTFVVQPDTEPALDDPAGVGFVLRRGRELDLVNVLAAGAATRGCRGLALAEIGLMREAGAAFVTDADRTIVDSRVLRRAMAYAKGVGAFLAHRPCDVALAAGACATEGELASRLGLPAAPAAVERIGLERDLALAELTGCRLLVDQVTTADSVERIRAAKARGVDVVASVSINHLGFNEIDIGDYRTFCRLDPPLRPEDDRRALLDAVAEGVIDVVVSAHAPAPAEDKRLPFEEAAPGAVGLETLLPALLSLAADAEIAPARLLRAVTSAPADLLGLSSGRIAAGAPADLVLVDAEAPRVVDALRLQSKSKNSPFDGRRLQGEVLQTWVAGRPRLPLS